MSYLFQIDMLLFAIFFFFFNDTATTEIYTRPYTLSLHDALPTSRPSTLPVTPSPSWLRKSVTSARSEEHTSELQSHGLISYAVFCLKKKKQLGQQQHNQELHMHRNHKWACERTFAFFFFSRCGDQYDLNKPVHSFPTRRSSD